jgi:hypothetical protein
MTIPSQFLLSSIMITFPTHEVLLIFAIERMSLKKSRINNQSSLLSLSQTSKCMLPCCDLTGIQRSGNLHSLTWLTEHVAGWMVGEKLSYPEIVIMKWNVI